MSKKYFSSALSGSSTAVACTIITNDLFLASFLHCVGCTLTRVERNERRRVSFVFAGERVRQLREEYRSNKVLLDMTAFRASMNLIRDRMDQALSMGAGRPYAKPEQRSVPCPQVSTRRLAPSPMQLSGA